jgi:hypothetical protein
MVRRRVNIRPIALMALLLCAGASLAQIGPCRSNGQDSSYCGEGDGAARIIPKTTSPSHRLALAWRLANRPPTIRPDDSDPDLESLIVRIEDGGILAKSRGYYWNLGDRYAPQQYFGAAWSPDSRLLIRTAGRVGVPDSAELFAFAEDDRVIGPFDLAKLLDTTVRAQMQGIVDADHYLFRVMTGPAISIDDQSVIHGSVLMKAPDSGNNLIYELTAQVTGTANSLDAKVMSISQYLGPYISVTAH